MEFGAQLSLFMTSKMEKKPREHIKNTFFNRVDL